MKKQAVKSDNKMLYKNYVYNSIYQLLILVIPLFLTPFTTRVLGAEGIGEYSYTRSIVTYFVLFGTVGSNIYAQRAVAYVNADKQERSKVFWEIFLFRCLLLSTSLILYLYLVVANGRYPLLFLIQTLDILAAMIDITWYFQGMEQFGKITIRNALVKISSAILILLIIRKEEHLWLYVLIYAASNLVGQLLMWKEIPESVLKISIRQLQIGRHPREMFLLFVPQIAIQVYLAIDKTMIELLTDDSSQTGYYELAQTIQRTGVVIVTAFGTAAASRVAVLKERRESTEIRSLIDRSYELVFFIAFPLALGIGAVSHNFVPWFLGAGYEPVTQLMILLCPLIIIIGLSNISGMQYMVPMGQQNQMTASTLVGAVINILLNAIWIPTTGAMGAAAASVVAECIVLLIQILLIRKILIKKHFIKNFCQALLSSSIMVLAIKITECILLTEPSFIHTLILVIEGAVIYLSMQILCKNHILIEAYKSICKWKKH